MKRLIVHIGTRKTGTTSIQDTLASILPRGDFQLVQFSTPNASAAVNKGYSGARINGKYREVIAETGRSSDWWKKRLVDRIASLDAQTAILSAESISGYRFEEVQQLLGDLKKTGRNIQVVCYVRSPKSYTESVYQQVLKTKFCKIEDMGFFKPLRRSLRACLESVGKDNLAVRKFSRSSLVRECVVADFCDKLGLSLASTEVVNVNESLSLDALKLLYIFRRTYKSGSADEMRRIVPLLAQVKGPKFSLHSQLFFGSSDWPKQKADSAWIEENFGLDMSEDITASDGKAVRCEEDMMNLGSAAKEWLGKSEVSNPEITEILAQRFSLQGTQIGA